MELCSSVYLVYTVYSVCCVYPVDSVLTKKFISKTTYGVIPACRESFFKKDAGQAGMTKVKGLCVLTYGLIIN